MERTTLSIFEIRDWLQVLGNEQYRSKSIQQTSDEGYMVSAVIQNDFGYDSICLIKTNENGTQQWIQTFNFGTLILGILKLSRLGWFS